MVRPEAVLEIGTFTGYATLCLYRGLRENGVLDTIEIDDELTDIYTRHSVSPEQTGYIPISRTRRYLSRN